MRHPGHQSLAHRLSGNRPVSKLAEPLLTVEHVHLAIRGQPILRDVNLQVRAGEIVALIGPNGAGKSTLARVALGLLRADSGQVWRQPGVRIGYMPQRLAMDDTLPLSVRRFVTLGTPATRDRVRAALAGLQPSGGTICRPLFAAPAQYLTCFCRHLSQKPANLKKSIGKRFMTMFFCGEMTA